MSMENSLQSRLRAAEAEAHALAGGVAVLQRLLDVGDARALVLERQAHAAAAALLDESRRVTSPPPP